MRGGYRVTPRHNLARFPCEFHLNRQIVFVFELHGLHRMGYPLVTLISHQSTQSGAEEIVAHGPDMSN